MFGARSQTGTDLIEAPRHTYTGLEFVYHGLDKTQLTFIGSLRGSKESGALSKRSHIVAYLMYVSLTINSDNLAPDIYLYSNAPPFTNVESLI